MTSVLLIPAQFTQIRKLTLKHSKKQDMSSNTFFFCPFYGFLGGNFYFVFLSSTPEQLEGSGVINVPGRVFGSNRSAGAALVAGIFITSVELFLPCIDQVPVPG